ncbi:MAG TPA: right-handed parallel beta-helix repeat-containing protein [Thermoplasmata archaeon]|nr:right-handed parallel beta-helix repeat-containing protein [Thermoplasmata archaeon]
MRIPRAVLGVAIVAVLMSLFPSGLAHTGSAASVPTSPSPVLAAPAALVGLITIFPNGTVAPGTAPISQSGNTYSITGSFAGWILDERNGSTLNGGGYTETTTPGTTNAVLVYGASGVTVKDLVIVNDTSYGFYAETSSSVAFVSDNATGAGYAVYAYQVAGLNVSNDQFSHTEGIYADYGSSLLVTSNDLSHTSRGIYVEYFQGLTVRNNNLSFGTSDELDIEYSANALVTQNTMYNTVAYTGDQVYLYEVSNTSITWNNGSAGDYLAYGEYATSTWVVNNHMPGIRYAGVYMEYSTGIVVDHNFLPQCSTYGFYGYYVSDYSFTNNQADHAGSEAVYVEYGTNGVIRGNNLSFFTYEGVYSEYSGNVTITSNQVAFTTHVSGEGIYTYEDSAVVIANNNASHDYYGWYDYSSTGVVATGNDFSHALTTGYAIYLYYDGAISIADTQGSDSYYGLYSDYTNGLSVTNTNFNHAGDEAMYFYYSTEVVLTNIGANNSASYAVDSEDTTHLVATNVWAASSGDYAFYLYESQELTLSGCDAARANYGVYADYDTGLVVAGTNLSQDEYGLYLYYSSGVTISGNTFWSDNFSFDYEAGNAGVLYHNNFLSDKGWIVGSPSNVAFSWANGYPVGGNFWSNYTGVDVKSGPGQNLTGSDRIGDSPYKINNVTWDPYPLMGAWVSHTITFTETGLAAGKSWSASVDGQPMSTSSNALVFVQNDGATASFAYAIGSVPGYHVSPASGSGIESGTNVVIALVFTATNYTVTFTVAGLPSSTAWSVMINGHMTTVTGATLTVAESNGTYTYVVVKGTDYSITPSTGTFTVSGQPVSVSLTATEILYNLTFTESGLSSGTSWSVTVNGVTKSSTGSTIIFQEPNGTYAYTVGSVGGYSVTPSKGTASVSGGAVAFAAAYSNAGLSGTSLGLLVALILILVVAIVGWVMYLRARRPKSPAPMPPAWSEGGPTPPPSPPPPPRP